MNKLYFLHEHNQAATRTYFICWLLTGAAAQERGRFGVGLATGVPRPVAALSLSADLTDAVALTGIIGPFGVLSSYGLRASYSFVLEPSYRVYAYGLGLLGPEGFGEVPPTVLTFGGGAGLEFSYLTLFGGDPTRMPPLWASLDLGLVNRSLLGEGPSGLLWQRLQLQIFTPPLA